MEGGKGREGKGEGEMRNRERGIKGYVNESRQEFLHPDQFINQLQLIYQSIQPILLIKSINQSINQSTMYMYTAAISPGIQRWLLQLPPMLVVLVHQ